MSYIIGRNSAGGGTGSTPSWSDVTNKPFSTVGEGLEVSNGALKECVPVYSEQTTDTVTYSQNFAPEREYVSTYTNEFYAEVSSSVINTIHQYSDSCLLYFEYFEAGGLITCSGTVQDIYNNGTETFTDSDGKTWHFYFTQDNVYHLTCLDTYDGVDLAVSLEEEEGIYYDWPTRVGENTYIDKFSCPLTESWVHNFLDSSTNHLYFRWPERNGYSQSDWLVSISDWDYYDDTAVYTDNGNYTWHVYLVDEDGSISFHADALDTLPAGTGTTASSNLEYTYTGQVTIYHKLGVDYIPIDNSTIQANQYGQLKANIPDMSDYVQTSDLATALTPYAESSSLATVATSGDYDDLSNKPTIPQPTSVTVSQTLQSGTAIADIDVDGVTTTLYAPAGGGSAPTPNWNATSGQDGFIMNKPRIQAGPLDGTIIGTGGASGNSAIGMGKNVYAKGLNAIVIGKDIMNNYVGQYSSDPNMFFGDGVNPYTTSPSIPTMYRGYKNLNWNDISNPQVNYLDLLGNGTSANARSNAEATDWSGNKYLAGDIYLSVTDWSDPQNNSIKLAPVPTAPTTAGTYTLQVVVDASGNPTYSWI